MKLSKKTKVKKTEFFSLNNSSPLKRKTKLCVEVLASHSPTEVILLFRKTSNFKNFCSRIEAPEISAYQFSIKAEDLFLMKRTFRINFALGFTKKKVKLKEIFSDWSWRTFGKDPTG